QLQVHRERKLELDPHQAGFPHRFEDSCHLEPAEPGLLGDLRLGLPLDVEAVRDGSRGHAVSHPEIPPGFAHMSSLTGKFCGNVDVTYAQVLKCSPASCRASTQ